ncbi:MAG: methenyltetrahydromethanopterin cyclohydrolase [Gammaproteobacteria bacterium]|nr:methenyltetrahydromethanopterin cyclohydrolase [Gammaproteobacteria bacterium]MCI0591647.1 methenyltetrahydromethanopterin cyclohydrolase [Gammaproteobacteria bacterium]
MRGGKVKPLLPSVNRLAEPLVQALLKDAASLRIRADTLQNGSLLVDAGITMPGGLEAGRRIVEICLGGLGNVSLRGADTFRNWHWHLDVHASNPVIACLGSQYAGWSLSHGKGKEAFNALASGPGRAMGSKEPLFDELGYRDQAESTCLVLEVDRPPPMEVVHKIVDQCGIQPDRLTLILTPTRSLCGTVQVVARVLEVALHKVHALGFSLEHIVDGAGSAPLCPPAKDFVTAMGRTNDAILFGGQVHLFVSGDEQAASDLAKQLPSSASHDYGKPFAQVFKDYQYDFFRIDPMLFSPAWVRVTALDSGRTFEAGRLDEELLDLSFGGQYD